MQTEIGAAPKTRIIYVGGGEEAQTALTLSFADAGYQLISHEDKQRADIGLIDLRGRKLSSRKAQAICNILRKSSPEISIIIIIDPYIDETARKALRRYGELAPMLTAADGVIERCRQILRLRNVAEETGERLKSLAGLSRLSDFPPISSPSTPLRILIAGKPGPEALLALNALKAVAEQCVCVFSAGQALRAVETSRIDAAIFLPTNETDPLMSLARSLKRHPNHSSMPVIFPLADPDDAARYCKRGASDFLLVTHLATDLEAKIQISVRRARLMKTMRQFLNACEGDGVRDVASGAFTSTFLSEHGARLCARADQNSRSMALAALQIETNSSDLRDLEPDRRTLHQAARLINRVTRAEDVVARVGSDTFFIMMPSTSEQSALKATQRIRGVLENTAFRIQKSNALFKVDVSIAACARPDGLCIEESVALALAVLRESAQNRLTQVN